MLNPERRCVGVMAFTPRKGKSWIAYIRAKSVFLRQVRLVWVGMGEL